MKGTGDASAGVAKLTPGVGPVLSETWKASTGGTEAALKWNDGEQGAALWKMVTTFAPTAAKPYVGYIDGWAKLPSDPAKAVPTILSSGAKIAGEQDLGNALGAAKDVTSGMTTDGRWDSALVRGLSSRR